MSDRAEAAAHWDAAYAQRDDTRSWFEEHPDMSLRVLGSAGEEHITRAGTIQPFTWIVLRRQS